MDINESQTVAIYAKRISDNEANLIKDQLVTQDEANQIIPILTAIYDKIAAKPGVNL